MPQGTKARLNREQRDRAKAIRAYELYKRGHSLLAIAEMCSIPTGSVKKRIELGERLLSVKGKH